MHNYGRDGWLSPARAQLLPSIFLSDERGERQHPVICCVATGGDSKSPAQSHPRLGMARGGVWWDRRGNAVNSIGAPHPPPQEHIARTSYAAVDSTTWEYTALWSISRFLILCSPREWIIEMVVQNRSGLLFISGAFPVVTVKAEALTVRFGTETTQRTCKFFESECRHHFVTLNQVTKSVTRCWNPIVIVGEA